MAEDSNCVAAYGKAYTILMGIVKKYYPVRKQSFLYIDKLRTEMQQSETEAAKEMPDFPRVFYREAASIIGYWFQDGFKGILSDMVYSTFADMWAFHKGYLTVERTEETWKEIMQRGREIKANSDPYVKPITDLYAAVVMDLGRHDDAARENRDE